MARKGFSPIANPMVDVGGWDSLDGLTASFFFFLQEQLLWLGVSYIRFRGCQGGLGWVFQGAGMWSLGAQKNRMGFLGPRAGVRIEPSVFGVGACCQHADPKWDTCPKPSARAGLFGGCQLRGARPQVCDVECVTGLNLWGLEGSTSGSYRKKRAPGPRGASAPGGGRGAQRPRGRGLPARWAWPPRARQNLRAAPPASRRHNGRRASGRPPAQ